ncbi:MAG: superoxide dismutase [Dysgonamonadaceae bacterium]|jgi:Fe-Mn family superoxide dismutase|nr:superoxide dismutase [Dysgonamonadaceae bacterium]
MKKISLLLLSTLLTLSASAQFQLPELPYSYDALEPYIDTKTMDIHYNRHHGAFVNNLNRILSDYPEWQGKDAVYLLKNLDLLPAEIRTPIRNNAGGFYNHSLFWEILAPAGTAPISARMTDVLVRNFGSFEAFQAEFERAFMSVFGSGWVWLMKDQEGKLYIATTPNQDNFRMDAERRNHTPILANDVWEHAYYLRYQNLRAEYVSDFWNVVNWKRVEELYFSF